MEIPACTARLNQCIFSWGKALCFRELAIVVYITTNEFINKTYILF